MGAIDPTLGSLAVALMIAFIAGGIWTWRKGDRLKGALMAVFALVILGNLLVMAIPVPKQPPAAKPAG